MDAFDADVLIYAAVPGHPLGRRVRALFPPEATARTGAIAGVDSVHLATAVAVGADRFITNNASDFPKTITEVEVTYPDDLPEP